MKICPAHWSKMRQAVDDRGMTGLVAKSGQVAVAQLEAELRGAPQAETFDPLMAVHWAVVNNAMQFLSDAGLNPLYLLGDGPEDPLQNCGEAYNGRTWPRCPLCYLNLAHEVTCTDPACRLDKVAGYEWMIERAANDALGQARSLGLMPAAS